ncbi:MAG: MBOAT family protein, partial [Crocinitomicaceae bacterium]|nr:MBOAT family protein [Crocinitomicaceae bacterium]
QILWGLFKKLVIADNCAIYVDDIFLNYGDLSGGTLFMGAVLFAFQIYGDFSGYSDIAIGTARLFGFKLMQNFAFPYFSRDIAEFWRRWHISLSSWFKDYLYIPLGGSQGGLRKKIMNVFLIFVVSGFWHGANWTFIFWGALNALYFVPLMLLGINRTNTAIVAKGKLLPHIKEFFQICLTFVLTTIAWIFFRAESLDHAFDYIANIVSSDLFSLPNVPLYLVVLICIFLVIEWVQRHKEHALQLDKQKIAKVPRLGVYYLIAITILWFSVEPQEFIYFKF